MGTLSNLFSHHEDSQNSRYAVTESKPKDRAPGTEISYDPTLITRLKGQNAILLRKFEQITFYAEIHNYSALTHSLEQFRSALYQHLLEEDSRVYTYLKNCLAYNEEDAYLMSGMHRRMFALGRAVTEFLRHYKAIGVNAANINEFKDGLKILGTNLQSRIECEESTIYTLYFPVDQYLSFSIKQHFARTKIA